MVQEKVAALFVGGRHQGIRRRVGRHDDSGQDVGFFQLLEQFQAIKGYQIIVSY